MNKPPVLRLFMKSNRDWMLGSYRIIEHFILLKHPLGKQNRKAQKMYLGIRGKFKIFYSLSLNHKSIIYTNFENFHQ